MTAFASDRIWWAPLNARATGTRIGLVHWCPTACIVAPTHRDQLDPMALGTCRYCGERLPVSPDKEKVASE